MDKVDKSDRSQIFRDRLAAAMALRSVTQSALARQAGVDRSTISALLAPGTRLPGAQLVADCAQTLGVTTDWLLGLAEAPEPFATRLASAIHLTDASRALFDDRIYSWHREAAGYKIRHVPATLPDLLKTQATVEWEYRETLGAASATTIANFQSQLRWLQGARSDYEMALPLHEISSFAEASGYWAGLSPDIRRSQMDNLILLAEGLYPALRLYLYDAHRVYSAPVTVFGAHRAVVYVGRHYAVFQDPMLVQGLSQHFDWLVREAQFGAKAVIGHLTWLRSQIPA